MINVAGHLPAHQLRQGQRGRLARRARGAPRRLPQRPRRRAPDHGRGRSRSDPRRHVRLGLASRPTPAPTAAPSAPSPRSPGSSAGARRRASSSTPCRRSPSPGWSPPRSAGRRRAVAGGSSATGGLSLGSMPQPEELGPLGAHLVGDGPLVVLGPGDLRRRLRGRGDRASPGCWRWCGPPTSRPWPHVLDAVVAGRARAGRGGAGHHRREQPAVRRDLRRAVARRPADRRRSARARSSPTDPELGAAVDGGARRLASIACHDRPRDGRPDFAGAADVARRRAGPVDAVVRRAGRRRAAAATVRRGSGSSPSTPASPTASTPTPRWARAVADRAAATERPIRLVTLTDATTAGGRSRAQASAQLARSARRATDDRVAAFAVSVESAGDRDLGSAARAGRAPRWRARTRPALSGAELVVGAGWLGLRSHPRPAASFTLGGPAIPDWFDGALREVIGAARRSDDHASGSHRRCPRAPVGSGPHRLVPVPRRSDGDRHG